MFDDLIGAGGAIAWIVLACTLIVVAVIARRSTRIKFPSPATADVPPEARAEIDRLLAAGQVIPAIKVVRESTD